MTSLLLRFPWFVSAPAVLLLAVVFAGTGYYFTGDYFNEECRNERNLLSGEFEASNCGEGAKVAKAQREAAGSGAPAGTTPAADAARAGVVASGPFRDGDPGHNGSGTAEVQRLADGSLNLFLRNFSVTNGPDLFVYLVAEANPGRSDIAAGLNLGELQANNGNQNYVIPAGTDIARYKSVSIWCRQFQVNFAIAALGEVQASVAPVPPPRAGVLSQGAFQDGAPGHNGSGTAQVQRLADGKLNLFFSNFSVTNGPDLVVVLSTDPGGSRDSVGGGLTLAALKANNGNQNYAIPEGTDSAGYRSVIIYCKSFPTVFAYATLEPVP